MREYRVRRTYLCTLLGSSVPQTVEVEYDIRETDDGMKVETMVHGSLSIVGEQEGTV